MEYTYKVLHGDKCPDGHNEWVMVWVDQIVYSIPYHSKASGYNVWRFDYMHDVVYDDAELYYKHIETGHFNQWLNMTPKQRTTIRRNTLLTHITLADADMARHKFMLEHMQFVTF